MGEGQEVPAYIFFQERYTMKRLYVVNFDFFNSHNEISGFSREYVLFEKFADNFLDNLRKMLPNMNIYIAFTKEARA
jgi:hypothetical protein